MASTVPRLDDSPVHWPAAGDLPDFAARIAAPSLGTYWRTLQPLRASQLLALARRRILPRRRPHSALPAQARLRALRVEFPEWRRELALRILERREFCFLNTPARWADRVDWQPEGFDRLWVYHLNYFDFLNVNVSAPECRARLVSAVALAIDWRNQNSTGKEIGWEPYPLSLRIVNWLKFLARNAGALDRIGNEKAVLELVRSLHAQTLALEAQIETDLTANHLLKNIKALIFAGIFIECREASRWRRKGERLLKLQIEEQILADGGHYERSPMYHAQVLEDLLDLHAASVASEPPFACHGQLPATILRMASYLRNILHPDGEIPLFNDSSLGMTQPMGETLNRARRLQGARNIRQAEISDFEFEISEGLRAQKKPSAPKETAIFRNSGYAVMRDAHGGCLIFDCGPLGPDHQPGHGHCDLLSYELSLNGKRVVVDTGVSTYERSPERCYERSTCAHNTIRVDGEDQAQIWASFRVGRRPKASAIESGSQAGCRFLRGEHYGYDRLGAIHRRTIFHTLQGAWVIVDSLRGTGVHRLDSFIHFHPDVTVERCASGMASPSSAQPETRWLLRFGGYRYVLVAIGQGQVTLKPTWYSPEFGVRQRRSTIHWMLENALPALMVYAFVPVGERDSAGETADSLKSESLRNPRRFEWEAAIQHS